MVLRWQTYRHDGRVEREWSLQSDQGDVVVAVHAVRVVVFGVDMDGGRQHGRLQQGFKVSVAQVNLHAPESASEPPRAQREGPRRVAHLDGLAGRGLSAVLQVVSRGHNPALCDHHATDSYAFYV